MRRTNPISTNYLLMFICCVSQSQDIIDEANGYVVLHTCPRECAAQVRVCEKKFVADHAQSLAQQIGYRTRLFAGWFSHQKCLTCLI